MAATDDLKHLIIEINGEIEHFGQIRNQVAEANARLAPLIQPAIYDLRSVAMLLTEIYLGAENLMRRVAKRLGETLPSGEAWHQQLLAQFSRDVPDLRPALFSPNTAAMLDEFRRFRHVTHHLYALEFDWELMSRLLSQADPLLAQVAADAETFSTFLGAASEEKP